MKVKNKEFQAIKCGVSFREMPQIIWTLPQSQWIKINVDVGFCKGLPIVGVVARDECWYKI